MVCKGDMGIENDGMIGNKPEIALAGVAVLLLPVADKMIRARLTADERGSVKLQTDTERTRETDALQAH